MDGYDYDYVTKESRRGVVKTRARDEDVTNDA